MCHSALSAAPRSSLPWSHGRSDAHRNALPPARAGQRPKAVLAVLCLAVLMVNLDNTILNVALPTLVDRLKATTGQLQWIVDAYAMVFGGLMMVGGSLADRYGRKRLFLAGWRFSVGSLGVPSPPGLIS